MKLLILARHAKSSWEYPELDDFERPLNSRGRRDAPEMAKRLASISLKPDLIWSSPANRAAMTARIYAAVLRFPLGEIRFTEVMYSDSHLDLFNLIKTIPDDHKQVLLVGHNPMLTNLANHLITERITNIPTAGVVGITLDQTSWLRVGNHSGKMEFFEFPKKKG
jgi:phosphohistidine phosphatase